MVQPAVTVRNGDRSNTSLMFGVVLAALAIHRLSVWGILDMTIIMPDAVAGYLGIDTAACGLLSSENFILTSTRVAFDDGFFPGAVLVERGKIKRVARLNAEDGPSPKAQARAAARSGAEVEDFGSAIISPGLIDVHVHMNEPGRVEWEGAASATRAAAAGGATTLVDMPLNSVPTTTTAAILRDKINAVKGKVMVDVGFWGGMVPANSHDTGELNAMLRDGALGFKSFFSPSGIDDFPNASAEDVAKALPTFAAAGVPLLAHAELLSELPPSQGDHNKYQTFLELRPKRFEADAIRMLIAQLRACVAALKAAKKAPKPGFGMHIAHLANGEMLGEIAAAKADGLPLTAEVNTHHLTWAAEDVPDGGTLFKCMPPLRDRANLEALWDGLKNGTIDMVASDHSPAHPDLKLLQEGDFLRAWGGIAGLQYSLPALVTGMAARGIPLERTAAIWAAAPAKLATLSTRKGRLDAGFDADVVVWDPQAAADTTAEGLHHKHKATPYVGTQLRGRVLATFVRGQQVFAAGRDFPAKPCGGLILRK